MGEYVAYLAPVLLLLVMWQYPHLIIVDHQEVDMWPFMKVEGWVW